MLPRIEKAKQIRASIALQSKDIALDATVPRDGHPMGVSTSNEAIVNTVPSRPQDGLHIASRVLGLSIKTKQAPPSGVQSSEEGDFGTVIIHDKVENSKTAAQRALTNAEESSPATRLAASPSNV